jgi:beta-lactamase class D
LLPVLRLPGTTFAKTFLMRKITAALCVLSLMLFACSPNNITEDNSIKKYFDQHKVTGTFGIFDNAQGEFTIYDLRKFTDSVYQPASTFKIVNALIAIEAGVANNDSTVLPWSGVPDFTDSCHKDLPMYQAFRYSCVTWFQQLARKIGKDTMQLWLDSLGYGSRYGKATIQKLDTFWFDNSVKLTPDEQLGLIKKLYFFQLPFKERTERIVKSMMIQEQNSNYILAYKTGWGHRENGNAMGWVIGWIEENRHPYPFALLIESPDPNFNIGATQTVILDSIFRHYGFKEGKK